MNPPAPRRNGNVRKSADGRTRSPGRQRRRKTSTVRASPILIALISLVVVWILASIYLTTVTSPHSNKAAGGMVSPHGGMVHHLIRKSDLDTVTHAILRGVNHKDLPARKEAHVRRKRIPKLKIDSTKVIDMRNLTATLPFDNPDGGAWKQGWNVLPKEGDLTVLVLPHSHCDPGWIKTFDEYFQSQTKSILSTVVQALSKDPKRKFIWAEISYFEWWWKEQSEATRQLTLKLLKNKQLEFVTGGWVQPDEANTQLYAMEVQLEEGHAFIRENLGEEFIPKYGWSIDPFGYSPTMAYLLKKYNFEGMLIQRVHYAVKKELAKRLHLEFMWRQTWDDKGEYDIFTHLMPFFSYDVPHTCGPDPSVCCQFDFARMSSRAGGNYGGCPWHRSPQRITSQNVKERSILLLDQYRKKAALYQSNVVLAPLGDDFRWRTTEEAEAQYTNFQKIMDYVNKNVPGVTIKFGTLSEYFEKVQGTFDVPVLKGSFFTYSDREQDYWSGYFTSRVFDKALDRKLERVLVAASSLGATDEELQESRRALSLFQHHDGVTGTAKDHVVQDYASRIHNAIHLVQDWMIEKLKPATVDNKSFKACWQSDAPRGLSQNLCGNENQVYAYNPIESSQYCGDKEVSGHSMELVQLPCEVPGTRLSTGVSFDPRTGLMTHPVQEHWMVWKVRKGGAYLFFPDKLATYNGGNPKVEVGGHVMTTPHWKRTATLHEVTDEFGGPATVIDFIYETNLQTANEEWFVRFSSDIQNKGVFHTDLNGFNFDTHYFREDLPIQSQVFPMPTLASIEDARKRMTVLSEHAQGTASLKDGSIDVWLDRRLNQDDERGLFQGVMDNVPTRTRLRLVLESDGYKANKGEFEITPLCRRMWDELNHPLELFGSVQYETAQEAEKHDGESDAMLTVLKSAQKKRRAAFDSMIDPDNAKKDLFESMNKQKKVRSILDETAPIVPFVFMVHKRADYLKIVMDTLLASDFDCKRVPLIISHDGRVPEVMSYVEELKHQFDNLIQIFHPYSCFDHPDSFPGNDEKLNEGFAGDTYGNKRAGMVTCCRHHFTWMIKTVFDMEFPELNVNAFFFLEEDYVVSPTIYETVLSGLRLYDEMTKSESEGYFGVTLVGTSPNNEEDDDLPDEGWLTMRFFSGPMVLTRDMWKQFQQNSKEYCTYDDYNWDWAVVHLMDKGLLPSRVLYPTEPQVMHVGIDGGLHGGSVARWELFKVLHTPFPGPFHGTKFVGTTTKVPGRDATKPYGGWGHPADHEHCLKVMESG